MRWTHVGFITLAAIASAAIAALRLPDEHVMIIIAIASFFLAFLVVRIWRMIIARDIAESHLEVSNDAASPSGLHTTMTAHIAESADPERNDAPIRSADPSIMPVYALWTRSDPPLTAPAAASAAPPRADAPGAADDRSPVAASWTPAADDDGVQALLTAPAAAPPRADAPDAADDRSPVAASWTPAADDDGVQALLRNAAQERTENATVRMPSFALIGSVASRSGRKGDSDDVAAYVCALLEEDMHRANARWNEWLCGIIIPERKSSRISVALAVVQEHAIAAMKSVQHLANNGGFRAVRWDDTWKEHLGDVIRVDINGTALDAAPLPNRRPTPLLTLANGRRFYYPFNLRSMIAITAHQEAETAAWRLIELCFDQTPVKVTGNLRGRRLPEYLTIAEGNAPTTATLLVNPDAPTLIERLSAESARPLAALSFEQVDPVVEGLFRRLGYVHVQWNTADLYLAGIKIQGKPLWMTSIS